MTGTRLNEKRISQKVSESVMLVTALSPLIACDKASEIAHTVMAEALTLRPASIQSGAASAEDFARIVDPRTIAGSGLAES